MFPEANPGRIGQDGSQLVATALCCGDHQAGNAAVLSSFLPQAPQDPAGQSGPSSARAIAWPILSAASTISRSPTWAYLIVIRGSV